MKNTKSTDVCELSIVIIKSAAVEISKPLAFIFNKTLQAGTFPSKLKFSKVVTAYKDKDPSDINNYRPTSLLPVVAKIFELLMLQRLNTFLTNCDIIGNNQHGFRKGYSTTSAAYQYLENVCDALDRHEQPVGIFLDLSKAFNLVNHEILLHKLFH
jgi:hypothetical protein